MVVPARRRRQTLGSPEKTISIVAVDPDGEVGSVFRELAERIDLPLDAPAEEWRDARPARFLDELRALADELPLATEIFPGVQNRRALYLALLMHDVAKALDDKATARFANR